MVVFTGCIIFFGVKRFDKVTDYWDEEFGATFLKKLVKNTSFREFMLFETTTLYQSPFETIGI